MAEYRKRNDVPEWRRNFRGVSDPGPEGKIVTLLSSCERMTLGVVINRMRKLGRDKTLAVLDKMVAEGEVVAVDEVSTRGQPVVWLSLP